MPNCCLCKFEVFPVVMDMLALNVTMKATSRFFASIHLVVIYNFIKANFHRPKIWRTTVDPKKCFIERKLDGWRIVYLIAIYNFHLYKINIKFVK
jgi:hypothetical protein